MITVIEYILDGGNCPYSDWFESLSDEAAAKVATAIARMKAGNFGDHKGVASGVIERRINYGPGYRIYFGKDGDEIVILLGGGTKKRQSKDIKNAQEIWANYKSTKKE